MLAGRPVHARGCARGARAADRRARRRAGRPGGAGPGARRRGARPGRRGRGAAGGRRRRLGRRCTTRSRRSPTTPRAREALGALPVPLADGRVVRGARGLVVLDAERRRRRGRPTRCGRSGAGGCASSTRAAAHPLLARLGARGARRPRAARAPRPAGGGPGAGRRRRPRSWPTRSPTRSSRWCGRPSATTTRATRPRGRRAAVARPADAPGGRRRADPGARARPARRPGGASCSTRGCSRRSPLDAVERWGAATLVAAGVRDDLALVRRHRRRRRARRRSTRTAPTTRAWPRSRWTAGPTTWRTCRTTLGARRVRGRRRSRWRTSTPSTRTRWPGSWRGWPASPALRRALLDPVRGERGATAPSYTAWWLRERGPGGLGGIFAVDADDAEPRAARRAAGRPGGRCAGSTRPCSVRSAGSRALDDLDAGGVGAAARRARAGRERRSTRATAVALWRGIAAAAARSAADAAVPERVPALVAPAQVAVVHADDAAVADQPMWWQRTDVAAMVPSHPARAEALARAARPPAGRRARRRARRRRRGRRRRTRARRGRGVLLGDAPATWVEHDELTVDGAPVDWWVTGDGAERRGARRCTSAGLAAGLAQAGRSLVGAAARSRRCWSRRSAPRSW